MLKYKVDIWILDVHYIINGTKRRTGEFLESNAVIQCQKRKLLSCESIFQPTFPPSPTPYSFLHLSPRLRKSLSIQLPPHLLLVALLVFLVF